MFPYTEKYTESDIQITIYCTKHTNNVKIHFLKIQKIEKIQNQYFQKNRLQNDQRFMAICMARLRRAYNSSVYIYIYILRKIIDLYMLYP